MGRGLRSRAVGPPAGSRRQYSAPAAMRKWRRRLRIMPRGKTSTNPPWPRTKKSPQSCVPIAGTDRTTCGRSAIDRARRKWATRAPTIRASPSSRSSIRGATSIPCHSHFRQRAEEVKRGVWQAGGFPVEMPAITLSEPFQKPTTMLYRNLLAMETEELLRSYPADGCVLMGGCDKTTPALLMGAHQHEPARDLHAGAARCCAATGAADALGSGSDVWKYWAELRAGKITEETWLEMEYEHRALAGPLHDDGNGVDDDLRDGGDGVHAARRRVDSRCRFAPRADGERNRPAHRRHGVGGHEAPRYRDRRRASTTPSSRCLRSAARPMPSCIWSRSRGVPALRSTSTASMRSRARRRFVANVRPAGKYLMEDFYYAGGLRALLACDRRSPVACRAHGERPDARREHRRRGGVQSPM